MSRTIIDKKAGTVSFFAFEEGQGLSEHTAPFDALVYLLDGEAKVIILGKTVPLKRGRHGDNACQRSTRIESNNKIQNDSDNDTVLTYGRV